MLTALIDYESGNLHSAQKAFERMAAELPNEEVIVTSDPEKLRRADRLVLPGDGAFPACKAALVEKTGLYEALLEAVEAEAKPFLGICVGMQLMATRGLEHGVTPGLDWIAGEVAAEVAPEALMAAAKQEMRRRAEARLAEERRAAARRRRARPAAGRRTCAARRRCGPWARPSPRAAARARARIAADPLVSTRCRTAAFHRQLPRLRPSPGVVATPPSRFACFGDEASLPPTICRKRHAFHSLLQKLRPSSTSFSSNNTS